MFMNELIENASDNAPEHSQSIYFFAEDSLWLLLYFENVKLHMRHVERKVSSGTIHYTRQTHTYRNFRSRFLLDAERQACSNCADVLAKWR